MYLLICETTNHIKQWTNVISDPPDIFLKALLLSFTMLASLYSNQALAT